MPEVLLCDCRAARKKGSLISMNIFLKKKLFAEKANGENFFVKSCQRSPL